MFYKNSYLNLFRRLNIKINKNISTNLYPWGWISDHNKIDLLSKSFINENIYSENTYYDIDEFKTKSEEGYKIVYNTYLNKKDFLEYKYTSFPLSFTLNYLNKNSDLTNLHESFIVNDIEIVDYWFDNSFIETNNIDFDNYKKHIWNNLYAGLIGPENRIYWDNIQTKQILRVVYISDKYFDIIDWERDVTFPDQKWQIRNINGIIN
jgi:hypothetical protein